jgi:tRNA A-37 threonylcarbamoyl transferase component Bud32
LPAAAWCALRASAATMNYRVLRDGPLGQTLCNTLGAAGPDCRRWMADHACILRDGAHSLTGLASIEQRDCYLKLFSSKSGWPALQWPPGRARALNGFDAAKRLRRASLPVPEPLCCLRVPAGTLLVTDTAPGADLQSLWRGDPGHALDWLSIMQRSAQSVAALHRAGYVHGDCRWTKLVLEGDRCALVGLEGVRRAARSSRREAADLARFTLQAEELQLPLEYFHAFVETYCIETCRNWAQVTAAVAPQLAALRRRRGRRRLGYRGHQLLGEK